MGEERTLPDGWGSSVLNDLFDLVYGKGLRSKELLDTGYSVYGANGIIGKYDNYLFEDPQVIISCRGAASGAIHKTIPKSFVTSNSIVLQRIAKELLDLDFVKYAMTNVDKQEVITGTAQPQITIQLLKDLELPIAPLPEQQRIVAKLDALFAHLETLNTQLERIPQLLSNFRQQVLTHAVTGKLTEDWREGKKVHSMNFIEIEKKREELKRNYSKQRGKKSFNYKESVEIDLGGKTKGIDQLFDLPEGWAWVTLDKVIWNVSDGPHFSPKYVDSGQGKRFISMRNISYKGINFDSCKYVSEEDHLKFVERGIPENGDVILTKGGTTGIACIIEDDVDFSYWVHLALLKPIHQHINSSYLRDALTSQLLYRQSQELTHGVSNQDLGLTRMIYMALPLPSIEEQQEIVQRVESLFASADRLEVQYIALKAQIDALPQALLNKAFKGELVPQDPNDEPASVLLERIQAEREQLTPTKKQKGGKR